MFVASNLKSQIIGRASRTVANGLLSLTLTLELRIWFMRMANRLTEANITFCANPYPWLSFTRTNTDGRKH